MLCFNNSGNVINNAKDGNTSQNIPVVRFITLVTSLVSMYNHIMESTDIKGIEANTAPTKELCLAISDMATINNVVIMIFIR